MPLFLIIVGFILRRLAPSLFYMLAIAFLAFLIIAAIGGIREKEFGWKEGLMTVINIIIVLWLM